MSDTFSPETVVRRMDRIKIRRTLLPLPLYVVELGEGPTGRI